MSASPPVQPTAPPLPSPRPGPPPAARPLAHSGFAAQSLTFRTGVRSHVLADSPHLPSTASSASSSSSSSLPTSTRPLTLEPGEGTHNQAGLRTGALGGAPAGPRAAREGKGVALPPPSVTQRARPPGGRRERAGPGEARPACAPPRPTGSPGRPPCPSPLPRLPHPPRCAARGRGRAEPAARRGRNTPTGGRGGAHAGAGTLGAFFCSAGRAGCVCTSRRGLFGREGKKGRCRETRGRAGFVRVAGRDSLEASEDQHTSLCLRNWPEGNKGWASQSPFQKGAVKHGFLQLAARTSLYCRSLSTH